MNMIVEGAKTPSPTHYQQFAEQCLFLAARLFQVLPGGFSRFATSFAYPLSLWSNFSFGSMTPELCKLFWFSFYFFYFLILALIEQLMFIIIKRNLPLTPGIVIVVFVSCSSVRITIVSSHNILRKLVSDIYKVFSFQLL